ncbi:uncharacterized protein LOC127793920 [Diospyros lotus]|uniref:uncharacterized protein LOC127793920 n=1 Tax=Diospyros lotus TaxID=55363 RepID=UPI002254E305|nr:uncharacterized protein LOC127793920 [Diospyros lotus]
MATRSPLLFLIVLLITATPPPSESLSYTTFQSLFSMAQSLMARVANLRAARGDFAGAERASLIARKLELGTGLGFWRSIWSLGWDYLRNYAWREAASFELLGAVPDINELLGFLNELTRIESESGRVEWVRRNYRSALRASRSLSQKLLKVFRQSGPLREVMQTVEKEVLEGELVRDCLELGGNDLKGLLQILKDVALHFSPSSNRAEL